MDTNRARELLLGERADVESLLVDTRRAGAEDRDAEDQVVGDEADHAQPLSAEYDDDAIADRLQSRLDMINRALSRIDDGTYGLSIRSGKPIPDERLEADPAAELTVDEARAAR